MAMLLCVCVHANIRVVIKFSSTSRRHSRQHADDANDKGCNTTVLL